MNTKKLIIDCIPPLVLRWLTSSKDEGWFGDYPTWKEAQNQSSGYDAQNILGKVKNSLLKVKNGEAVFERDSVIFDQIDYSWPVLALIMAIAAKNGGSINLIDFGGSLGSSYYQNLKFLKMLKSVSWNIIEQENFVTTGKENFENEQLKFYYKIEDCIKETPKIDFLLLSSVIQYIEKPYELISHLLTFNIPYIMIDRTGFNLKPRDRITIQKVPERIYKASYPCWFLNKEKTIASFKNYELINEFFTEDKANIPSCFKGLILKKIES